LDSITKGNSDVFTVEFANGNLRIYNNQKKYKTSADAHSKSIINLK